MHPKYTNKGSLHSHSKGNIGATLKMKHVSQVPKPTMNVAECQQKAQKLSHESFDYLYLSFALTIALCTANA